MRNHVESIHSITGTDSLSPAISHVINHNDQVSHCQMTAPLFVADGGRQSRRDR